MTDYTIYCALAKKFDVEHKKLKQRACEVFIKIYEHYLKDCSSEAWYEGWLSDACKQDIGLTNRDSRLTEVDVSLDENGHVYLHSTFTSQGETDDLYGNFDGKFLWDEDALNAWIEQSNKDHAERVKQKKAQETAAVEAKERAEYERLKAKYGN